MIFEILRAVDPSDPIVLLNKLKDFQFLVDRSRTAGSK